MILRGHPLVPGICKSVVEAIRIGATSQQPGMPLHPAPNQASWKQLPSSFGNLAPILRSSRMSSAPNELLETSMFRRAAKSISVERLMLRRHLSLT
jgi:hypothetical protein